MSEMTEAQRAAILFGDTTGPKPAQAPASTMSAADRLFGATCVTEAEAAAGVREKFRMVEGSPYGVHGKLHIPDGEVAHLREGPAPLETNQRQERGQQQERGQAVDVEAFGLDELSAAHVGQLVQELGMAPEHVTKMLDTYDNYLAQQSAAWAEASQAEFNRQELRTAATAFQQIADPELTDLMNTLGIGNHPALIRMAIKIGRILEDY